MTTLVQPKQLLTQPVYQRIEADLRHRIATGAWSVGAPLPSRAALAKEYGVGLATLERAISGLLADGTLRATPGQHTVVAPRASLDGIDDLASQPQHGNSLEAHAGMLGVVSYDTISEIRSSGSEGGWLYQISHSLERSFLETGGVTTFKSLVTERGHEPIPLVDAIRDVRQQGAVAIAVVDLNGAISVAEIDQVAEIHEREAALFVYVSSNETDSGLPHVYYDSAHLGRQAVRHLVSRGFDAFGYVSPFDLPWSVDRFESASEAAMSLGLGRNAVTPLFGTKRISNELSHAQQQYDAACEFGRETFSRPDYPRCVIAANDYIAFGLIDAANEFGIRHGIHYAILGFDDEVKALHYGLTTFRPPLEEIGTETALLLARLLRSETCSLQVRLRCRLIARASTIRTREMGA
jgi:DNA-binding LacI/PurR family transcriptional regulator/DNA-binding transcriptional regulator YhcF (GntR family)